MSELPALHAQSMKLVMHLRGGLETLELIEAGTRFGDPQALARDLKVKLNDLKAMRTQMDSTWRVHVMRETAAKRDVWKRKVQQVAEEADAIEAALDKYGTREQRRAREAAEREELFARAESGRQATSQMDEEAGMAASIHRSKAAIEEMYQQGAATLAAMMSTRERLKRTQRKVLDVLNSVGLGDKLLRMIDRRHKGDKWLVYGGMVFVVLFTFFLMRWWWR